VEAKRRGAARVVGVDGQRHHVRQALFVRKVLGLDLEFRRFNVYDLTPETVGQFHITLALGLVYHLKHLVLALERLFEITRELLVVESAIVPAGKTPESFVQQLGTVQQTLHPLFYADNPPGAKEQVFNWFLPSASALEALLRNIGFVEVSIFSTLADRAVLVCRKHTASADAAASGYAALIEFAAPPPAGPCAPRAELKFALRVTNVGRAIWRVAGDEAAKGVVRLGAHLLRHDEEEVDWNWGRAILPKDLPPRHSADVEFLTRAPGESGDYIIEFDLVAEHVTWFEDYGPGMLRHRLAVR
jgi:hypothetical protein